MDLLLAVGIATLIVEAARVVMDYLNWRQTRASPSPSPSVEQEESDEGLELFALLFLAILNRRRGRARDQ